MRRRFCLIIDRFGLALHFTARTSTPPRPLDVKRNSIFNLIGCLMYQGCQWLITVLVVLLSGYDNSGVLSYAMSIGNIFLPIATFNLRTYQVSDISGKFSEGEYIAFRLLAIAVAFLVIIPYTMVSTTDVSWVLPTLLYLLFKADESICDVLSGVSQKGGRMDYIGISQFMRGIAVVCGFCICLVVTHSLNIAVLSMFVCCAAITMTYDFPHARLFGDINVSINRHKVKKLVIDGLPLVLSATFASMIVTYARQAFGNEYGSTMLGYYAAVATPSVLVQAAARYLYCPVLVPLASRWSNGCSASFIKYFVRSLLMIALGAGCMAVMVLAFCPSLLKLIYGSELNQFFYLIPVMVLGTVMNTFLYFLLDVLVILRNLRGAVISGLIGFCICLVMSKPMISLLGMDGLNYIVVVSYTIAVGFAALCILASVRARRRAE